MQGSRGRFRDFKLAVFDAFLYNRKLCKDYRKKKSPRVFRAAGRKEVSMDIIKTLAQELEIKEGQAEAAVQLIDDGKYDSRSLSRYRKEMTGSLG